jgi:dipeptidyl aminopeptidase/acylaminoacyl peptidase
MHRVTLAVALAASFTLSSVQAAPPPLEAYGRRPAIEMVDLSPSGDFFAALQDFGAGRQLVVRKTTGEMLYSAGVNKSKVRSLKWAGDDHVIMYVSNTVNLVITDDPKNEILSGFNFNISKKSVDVLLDHNPHFTTWVVANYGNEVIGGRAFAFLATVPKESSEMGTRLSSSTNGTFDRWYPDLYKVDLADGVLSKVAPGSEITAGWAIDEQGQVVASAQRNASTFEYKVYYGPKLIFSTRDVAGRVGMAGLGRTPGTVLVHDESGEVEQLFEITSSGESTELLHGRLLYKEIHSSVSKRLIGLEFDQGRKVEYFDPKLQARYDAATKPFAGRYVTVYSAMDNLDRIILHTSGTSDSGTFWLVDLKAGRADIIDNDYPGVPEDQVGASHLIHYTAADGMALDGVLTLPPGRPAKNLPVIVMPHGGPIGVADGTEFDWLAQAYASRGYAVFKPNYRGSGGRGAAYQNAGYGEFGRKMLSDMTDGLDKLAANGIVDAKRACIVGGSYGGYAAEAGITLQQGRYRCAVAIAGLSDLPGFMQWLDRNRGLDSLNFWRKAMGVGLSGAPSLAAISPALIASRADAPLLLIHGKDDTRVPYEQSDRMARAMAAAGKTAELVTLVKEDHFLSFSETRLQTLKAAMAFVQKYNPAE